MSVALSPATAQTLIDQAAGSTMSGLFANQARSQADAIAIDDGHRQFTYCILDQRVNRLAALLRTHGVTRGERVAVLCENRIEYLEIMLGAARIGAIVACQNWRLAASELKTCLQLADPRLVITSARHRQLLAQAQVTLPIITFEDEYETLLAQSALTPITECAGLEDPLLMLYTSGTTGLPKAALISHRAEIARNLVVCAEFGVTPQDTFVAWSPLYHMGAAEISLGTLMNGGKIMVVDGFDVTRLATLVGEESLGWLLIMPGMVEAFADELESRAIHPCGVKLCGVMADLVPRHLIARITRLVDAPFANTFGATE
ncbi:MAG: acyl-CoA synthetase (AMP-forming)/AMP-acid ligase II, partial [Gammaproteobacteria bacterium]